MKALILAAGKGERLGDITKTIPKPMIEIKGKPILQYNIEKCIESNIKEIYINLHYLPKVIMEYFGNGSRLGVQIKYILESKLLGTGGTIRYFIEKFKVKDNFFVLYGDNITNCVLCDLITEDNKLKIAFHHREDVSNSGVAEFNSENQIISFIEKPKEGETASNWVNAGVYYLNPNIKKYISKDYSDFSFDVLPKVLKSKNPIYGHFIDECLAVDTPEMLKHIINSKL